MGVSEPSTLLQRRCEPCEGGVQPLTADQTAQLMQQVPGWFLADDGKSIYFKRSLKNFVQSLELLNKIGQLAENEQHHPDLHLTGYRNVRIVLTTHAIGGLSENDFIVAAKINEMLD